MLGCVGVVLYLRIHGCHEQLGGDKGNRMALRLGLCGIRWQCVCIFFQSFQLLGIDKFDRGACYMVAVIDIIEIVGSDVWHVSKQLRETLIYQRLNGIGSSHVWFHVIIIGFACQYMNHIIALTDSSVGGSPYFVHFAVCGNQRSGIVGNGADGTTEVGFPYALRLQEVAQIFINLLQQLDALLFGWGKFFFCNFEVIRFVLFVEYAVSIPVYKLPEFREIGFEVICFVERIQLFVDIGVFQALLSVADAFFDIFIINAAVRSEIFVPFREESI